MSERVLVCGGRDFADRRLLYNFLDVIRSERSFEHVIQGGQRGVDTFAYEWAIEHAIPCTTYPADWLRYGKGAGPRRNARMLTEGKPTLVIAFPGGRGTADMVDRAKKAGIEVIDEIRQEQINAGTPKGPVG